MGWLCSQSHVQSAAAEQRQLWFPESQLLKLLPSQTNHSWRNPIPIWYEQLTLSSWETPKHLMIRGVISKMVGKEKCSGLYGASFDVYCTAGWICSRYFRIQSTCLVATEHYSGVYLTYSISLSDIKMVNGWAKVCKSIHSVHNMKLTTKGAKGRAASMHYPPPYQISCSVKLDH